MNYFQSIFFTFFIFVHGIIMTAPKTASPISEYVISSFRSKKIEKRKSYMKKDAVLKYCHKLMATTYPNPETEWSCSISVNQENAPTSSSSTSSPFNRLYCFCSHNYSCIDTEQFHLESALVETDDYINVTINSFYRNKCEQSLDQLTNETSWSCELQFDRIAQREFYCECKRDIVCERRKILKFKSNIRLNSH